MATETNGKRKIRGYATYDGDEFTFAPSEKGEAQQLNIVSLGKNKIYETNGRRNSIVAHLVCDGSCADPAAEMVKSLRQLSAKMKKPFPKVSLRDVSITDYDDLKVRAAQKELKIYMKIPLSSHQAVINRTNVLVARLLSELYLAEDTINNFNDQK